jgi:hypothetical protein
LPKEFQFCRIPTPADRKLEISIPNGMPQTVTLNDGTINLVYVKSIGPATPLIVSQYKLNGSTMFTPPAPVPAPAPAPVAAEPIAPVTPVMPVAPAENASASSAIGTAEMAPAPTAQNSESAPAASAPTTTTEDAKSSALNQAVETITAPAETAPPTNQTPETSATPAAQNSESESNASAPAMAVEPAMDVAVPTRPPEIAAATEPVMAALAPETNAPAEPAMPEPAK